MIDSFDKVLVVLNRLENVDNIFKKVSKIVSDKNYVLEVLYVHEEALFDIPDFFTKENNQLDKEKIKQEIKSLVPKECVIFVYVDDTVDRVLELVKDQENLLIVTPYHKGITDKLVKEEIASLLVLKSEKESFSKIIMPVDLSDKSRDCINFVKKIFIESNIKLLHDNTTLISKELQEEEHRRYKVLKQDIGLEGYSLDEHFINEIEFVKELYSVEKHIAEFINSKDFDLSIFCSDRNEVLLMDLVDVVESDVLITDL